MQRVAAGLRQVVGVVLASEAVVPGGRPPVGAAGGVDPDAHDLVVAVAALDAA